MEAAPSNQETPPPPVHIAIIMDGNGRWARGRGMPRTAGHRRGAGVAREVVKGAAELGVSYLTLYSFSSENWNRPRAEVDDLMGLLRHYLRSEVAELHKNDVRLRVIGDRTRIPTDIVNLIEHAEGVTRSNARIQVVIALSYGSRGEIVEAAQRLAADAVTGRLHPGDIDEDMFARRLYTVGIPDPDLVIRTSGEQRLSNFLMWQAAYAEFVFTDTLWPDFTKRDLEDAIREYHRRDRRYGAAGG